MTETTLHVDGLACHMLAEGDGSPLLMLHGAASTAVAWSLNLEGLSTGFRCLAPDLPNCGLSGTLASFWPLARYARFMVALLDVLGIGRAHVMGNSMGAVVAVEMAVAFPERVDRLVLVAPPPVDAVHQGHTCRAMLQLVGNDRCPRYRSVEHARLVSPLASPTMLMLANQNLAVARGFYDVLAAVLNYRYHDQVPKVQAPTLLVWGAQDGLVPLTAAPSWRELLTCPFQEHVFDGAGHCPQFDIPLQFNAIIKGFLN